MKKKKTKEAEKSGNSGTSGHAAQRSAAQHSIQNHMLQKPGFPIYPRAHVL